MRKAVVGILVLVVLLVVAMALMDRAAVAPTVEPTSAPELTTIEPNYTDPDFGYRLYIPEGMAAEKQNKYSTLFYPEEQPMGPGPVNFIYISVVTPEMRNSNGEVYNYNPDHFEKLIALENIGDSVNLAEGDVPNMAEWFTYTVVEEVGIDAGRSKNFENTRPWEFPGGTTENRFIYGTSGNIYILGYYSGGDSGATIDPLVARQSILSFKAR